MRVCEGYIHCPVQVAASVYRALVSSLSAKPSNTVYCQSDLLPEKNDFRVRHKWILQDISKNYDPELRSNT